MNEKMKWTKTKNNKYINKYGRNDIKESKENLKIIKSTGAKKAIHWNKIKTLT